MAKLATISKIKVGSMIAMQTFWDQWDGFWQHCSRLEWNRVGRANERIGNSMTL